MNELNPFGLLVTAKTRIGGKTLYGLPIVKKDEIKPVAVELGEPPARRNVICAHKSVPMHLIEDAEFNVRQHIERVLGQAANLAALQVAKENEYPRYAVDYKGAEFCVIHEDEDSDLIRTGLDEFLKAPFATDKQYDLAEVRGYFPVQFFL